MIKLISRPVSRRTILAGAAAAGLAAPLPAAAQVLREITVGTTPPTAASWPTLVAEELGYFKRYRLDPKFIFIGSVASIAQQAIAGSIDFGEMSSAAVVEAVKNGANLRYFCESTSTPPYAFLAQKEYKKYTDLKGKLVIIGGPADITVIFTEKMFASGGLKMSDVDFTYAGATTDRYAALKSGSVAAAILFPPLAFRAADEGYSVLGQLASVLPEFPFGGFVSTDKYAQAHPDVLTDFAKAHMRGQRWINDPANRTRAIEILVKRSNVSLEDAGKTYDLFTRSKVFAGVGVIQPRRFQLVLDALANLKIITPPLPAPTAFFDNRYAEEAGAQLRREPKT
jgi:NitT/TauT family transport system substrate-binding protein